MDGFEDDLGEIISCAQEYLLDKGYSVTKEGDKYLPRKSGDRRLGPVHATALGAWAHCARNLHGGGMNAEEAHAIHQAWHQGEPKADKGVNGGYGKRVKVPRLVPSVAQDSWCDECQEAHDWPPCGTGDL